MPNGYAEEVAPHASWDALRQRIQSQDHLDEDLRRRAVAAVDMFERLLGNDWPLRMFVSRHPLAECFHNSAPLAVAAFVRISDVVRDTREVDGWLRVAGRLNSDPDHAVGAIAELTFAARAKSTGVALAFSPPNGHGGHADLLVSDGTVDLYVEICVTKPLPAVAARIESLENRILPMTNWMASTVAYGGHFLREPTEDEVESLAAQVAVFVRNVELASGLHVLTVANLLELRCVRFDDPRYQECADQGLVGNFQGITFAHSPLQRLINTIRNKARQLPVTGPGLLVVTPPSFLGQPPPTDELVNALQQTLSEIPRLLALALHWYQGAWPATETSLITASHAFLVQKVVHPPLVERLLLIRSPTADDNTKAFDLARRIVFKVADPNELLAGRLASHGPTAQKMFRHLAEL
jgi:hypothetical protein